MATFTQSSFRPRLSPTSVRKAKKMTENTEAEVSMEDDAEETEKPEFTKSQEAAINSGDIEIKDAVVKIPAETAKTDKDLEGTFKSVTFKNLKGALAYFEGKEEDLLDSVSKFVTATRKQSARQRLINDAVPEETRKTRQAAKRLVGIWPGSEDEIFAKLMSLATA